MTTIEQRYSPLNISKHNPTYSRTGEEEGEPATEPLPAVGAVGVMSASPGGGMEWKHATELHVDMSV